MRTIAALLLLAALYADTQLYAAKRAHAEEGSGRILVKPLCVSTTPGCDFWEIGWLDLRRWVGFSRLAFFALLIDR